MTLCVVGRYWPVTTLQQAAELSAIMAVTTAMIIQPAGGGSLSIDSFQDAAVCAVHIFTVLLVAVVVNININ